jgi:hypothetical protein
MFTIHGALIHTLLADGPPILFESAQEVWRAASASDRIQYDPIAQHVLWSDADETVSGRAPRVQLVHALEGGLRGAVSIEFLEARFSASRCVSNLRRGLTVP